MGRGRGQSRMHAAAVRRRQSWEAGKMNLWQEPPPFQKRCYFPNTRLGFGAAARSCKERRAGAVEALHW